MAKNSAPTTTIEALDAWNASTARDDLKALRALATGSAELLNFDAETLDAIITHLDLRESEKA